MKKKIWIFNHHANSMFFDEGGRHYSFAKYLKQKGYEPVIFCSNAKHGTGELYFQQNNTWEEHINETIDVPFVFVKGRPYKGNGKNRVLCMVDYYKNVKKAATDYSRINGAPDVIIGSQVHPLAVVAAINLAKSFKIKSIAEIRDLWPESFVAYGIASEKSFIVRMLRKLEKWIYVHADKIIFTMEGGYEYIKNQGWEDIIPQEKVSYINNGVDLEIFNYNKDNYVLCDHDLDNEKIFKVVYTGSIRKVNNLGLLLDAAKLIDNQKIKILIWGDGDEAEMLIARAREESIVNVDFKGRVDKKYIPYIVSKADLNIAHNEPSSLFIYGISFNKIFDYFAAGKPILSDINALYNPIEILRTGIDLKETSADKIAEAILYFANISEEQYTMYCNNAKSAASRYSISELTKMLLAIIT